MPVRSSLAFSPARAGDIDVRRPSVPYALVREDGARRATLYVYGEIGFWGITAASVAADLALVRDIDVLKVRISSYGGEAFEGLAIHNLLRAQPFVVEVVVDGIAASAASVIAIAGDRVVVAESAMIMIHDPWTITTGNAAALRKEAEILDKLKAALIAAYRRKAPELDEARLAALLSEETWLSGPEAVALGLADAVVEDEEAPVAPAPSSSAQGLFRACASIGDRVAASLRQAIAARAAATGTAVEAPAAPAPQDPGREDPAAVEPTPAEGADETAAAEGAETPAPAASPEAPEAAPAPDAPAPALAAQEGAPEASAAPVELLTPETPAEPAPCPVEIAEAAVAVGVPASDAARLAASLIASGASRAAIQARLAVRAEVGALWARALKTVPHIRPAEADVLGSATVADARKAILKAMAAGAADIDPRPAPPAPAAEDQAVARLKSAIEESMARLFPGHVQTRAKPEEAA